MLRYKMIKLLSFYIGVLSTHPNNDLIHGLNINHLINEELTISSRSSGVRLTDSCRSLTNFQWWVFENSLSLDGELVILFLILLLCLFDGGGGGVKDERNKF